MMRKSKKTADRDGNLSAVETETTITDDNIHPNEGNCQPLADVGVKQIEIPRSELQAFMSAHPDLTQDDAIRAILATPIEKAGDYLGLGWSIFPLLRHKKNPIGKWGKWQKTLPTGHDLEEWIRLYPKANLAIACGEVSGVFVLDIDSPEGQEEADRQGLPQTVMAETWKGKHYFFNHPGWKVKNATRLFYGADIKGDGGYIVLPPSIHPESGKPYEWINSPFNTPLADAPQWLLDLIQNKPQDRPQIDILPPIDQRKNGDGKDTYAETAKANLLAELAQAQPKVNRNSELNRIAFRLGQFTSTGRLNRAEVEQQLYAVARAIGLTDRETRATIESGLNAGEAKEPEFVGLPTAQNIPQVTPQKTLTLPKAQYTDVGNGKRFALHHHGQIRYCKTWLRWLVWDGLRWQPDGVDLTMSKAKETTRLMYKEAYKLTDDKERKAAAKHALDSENLTRVKAMLTMAQSEPGISVKPDDLDASPWLLNVQNGTIDLKTGNLLPHRQDDLITKLAPVIYDPGATCPTFLAFLDRIMAGNQDLINFLQRAIGYSLTGDTSEDCFFILHGRGANGKTTLLRIVGDILGDYSQQTPTSTLMVKYSDNIPADVARLNGARFVSAAESEEGQRLAEGLIKQLTGGDKITARFMRENFFDFVPELKLWLGTNHKPQIRGTDYAIWRRIRLIPFNVTIPENEQDKHLPDKLQSESSGILSWAVLGCLNWQIGGLNAPQGVISATSSYQNEMDILGSFLLDCCNETGEARSGKTYTCYSNWCYTNGEKAVSSIEFSNLLLERGFEKARDKRGVYWKGLSLKEKDAQENLDLDDL